MKFSGGATTLLLFTWAGVSAAVTIDFDGLLVDQKTGLGVFPADSYVEQGLLFDNSFTLNDNSISQPGFNPIFLANGGTAPNSLIINVAVEPDFEAFLSFVLPGTSISGFVNAVSIHAFDANSGSSIGVLEAFDINNELLDNDTATTPAGGGGVLLEVSSPGIAFLRLSQDSDGGQFDNLTFPSPELPECDFTADGLCDTVDLDFMQSLGPIAPGVPSTGNESVDLNDDGVIDLIDREEWLAVAATYNLLGSPYKLGDANLDGVVDGEDFIAWNGSKFTSDLLWSHGDFNGDGVVDGQDFILWNANKFTSSDAVAVPEPGTWSTWWLTMVLLRIGTMFRRSSTTV